MKNFRDKWVGSSEGNLEKIFRLIHALRRCYVFIDEADQSLGRRDASSGDSGISGRIYSMLAEEMGSSSNRGSIIWVLASSRPDLIEVDLKRPGRVDVKIPLFPTSTARESFDLLRMLLKKRGIEVDAGNLSSLEGFLPLLLTPAAAERSPSRSIASSEPAACHSIKCCFPRYVSTRIRFPRTLCDSRLTSLSPRPQTSISFRPFFVRPQSPLSSRLRTTRRF
jgi:hypothetical protein